jgi:predicted HTH transcriptional regulator
MYCKPPVTYEIQRWQVEGKTVLEVFVDKSPKAPHSAPNELGKWTVYVRQHDENRVANGVEILIMKLRFGKKGSLLSYTRSEQMVLDYLKTHPTISLKDVTRIARLSQTEAERMLAHLVVYEVLHMENIEREPFFSIIDKI